MRRLTWRSIRKPLPLGEGRVRGRRYQGLPHANPLPEGEGVPGRSSLRTLTTIVFGGLIATGGLRRLRATAAANTPATAALRRTLRLTGRRAWRSTPAAICTSPT